ncbi:uncharacterized protein MONOS_9585 [Monocercomonoides exilis]|uniref:uncharacterized protein n=1 Tax=Monocercomonoides exilis TaxID=2049356 RepID=UPI00355982F7|nr:hypothetical protein MONOS_9585 [Monocercomonoides exilis]|eukprot:MONOS_9585.1-p1 / transcript=MONOS_9585.1 / gene=MONOS_9585 / organism=Monocercomonoides_exilis_PA203 / gene_product=unspecified product / transcript_product=unspecified product / location=Mono_scaffold00401:13403-17899(+) / protein_length=1025 / sequence_SO=supercontig / SO=protein_coding / is_pseudo=false
MKRFSKKKDDIEDAQICRDREILPENNEYTEKLKEICKKFHSRSPKMDDLRTDSKEALELLKKFFGKMETVPSEILNDLLEYGSRILKVGEDEVIRTYGMVLEMLTNPFSYSKGFHELKEVAIEQKADNSERQISGKENAASEKVTQSDFLASPLLKQIVIKCSLIPAVVESIHASENDETLSVLSKFLLNVVRMNDSSEAIRLVGQRVLDGLDDILIRCQNADGLSDAIDALCLMYRSVLKNGCRTNYNFMDAFKSYGFRGVLMEIIVGNRKRGIVKEVESKKMTRYNLYNILENVVIEKEEKEDVEGIEEENKETKLKAKKPKKGTKSAERTGNNSKTRIGKSEKKLPAKQESSTKRKQLKKKEGKDGENKNFGQNSASTSTSSSSSSLESDMMSSSLSDSSSNDFVLQNLDLIPVSVRLKAVFALYDLRCNKTPAFQVKSILCVLVDSLELKEGEEEEYERTKQKELAAAKESKEEKEGKEEKEEKEGKEEKEKEKENEGDDEQYLMYAKVDFTECDYQRKYQRIREVLVFMIHFLNNNLPNLEKPLPESIVIKAAAAFTRLIKFPHRAFEHYSWICLSDLSNHSDALCRRLAPMFESDLQTELDCIEQEMEDAVKRDAEKGEKEYKGCTNPNMFARSPCKFRIAQFFPKPRLSDYTSYAEFERACEKYRISYYYDSYEFTMSLSESVGANFILHLISSYPSFFTPLKYHISLSSQRFHYICSFLAINTLNVPDLADKIVLDSIFHRLMEKIANPFPLAAPITITGLRSGILIPRSLESAQINAEFLVVAVLTSVVKELPYVFEMGYVSRLLEWMASKGAALDKMLLMAIKVLHEKCVAFSLSSRLNRLEMIGPINDALAKRNAFIEEHMDNPWGAPNAPSWDNISQLDDVICLPPDLSNANSRRRTKPKIVPLVSMDEEIAEVEKEDDTGTHLLWLLDDAIEESGIRDVVEAAMAHGNLQLFWMLPRVTPKLSKNHSNRIHSYYNPSDIDLPRPFAFPSNFSDLGIKKKVKRPLNFFNSM